MTKPDPIQHTKPPGRPERRLVAAGVMAVLALVAVPGAGCLPRSAGPAQFCEAPAIVGTSSGEREQWRRKYEANRPAAPENYQVFPKPPRDNSFGEFDDALHQGLDRQPALPALAADRYPLPPSRLAPSGALPPSRLTPSSPPAAPVPFAGTARPVNTGAAAAPPPASVSTGARSSGIVAAGHFYPVEQLVFGGEYPDIDKPELYRLMPRDVITITVKDHPEFSGTLEIQPDGTVGVPNAPDLVRLRGLTVEEAATTLQGVFAVYIRGECKVRVQANRARGGYYFVFGDVLQPGRFPMGLEPIRLSEAVLAANWEANPSRLDADGDELGPSFPAASPRGRYVSPPSADLAGVLLITPHRSQPVRTRHDVRQAMLGVTAGDPLIRPGQIVVVPSLDAGRNRELGLEAVSGQPVPSPARIPGQGFSTANSSARLPGLIPAPAPRRETGARPYSRVENNMANAFDTNFNTYATRFQEGVTVYE